MTATSKDAGIARETWIFIVIYTLLSLFMFDPKLFTGGDNAVYIALGESITSGKGYKNIYLPDEPSHTQYPFGFPLLLALFIMIFGKNIIILKIVVFLCGVGALVFTHRIFRDFFKENVILIMVFYLSVPILIIYNHWILSEMPFLFVSLGAIYFSIKFQQKKTLLSFFFSSIFAIYAFFIRTAGVSIIIAVLLSLLAKRQFKYCAIFSVLCLASIVPWLVRNARVADNTGYLGQLLAKNPYQAESGKASIADLAVRVWENFIFYTSTIIPGIILPVVRNTWISAVAGFTFLVLAAAGFFRQVKEFAFLEIYTILGTAVLLIWPRVWSSDRFFLPLLPAFLIYLFIAVFWIGKRINSRHLVKIIVLIIFIANAFYIVAEAKTATANNLAYLKGDPYAGYTPDWRRYFELIEWIKQNIPKDKIIMARKPEFVYFISGNKSFCYPFSRDAGKINEAIARSDYIILDNFYWTGTTGRYLYPVVQERLSDYELVHQTRKPEFYLLKVIKK